jgi:hypothetical protein
MKRALVAVLFGCLTVGTGSLAMAFDNDQAAITVHLSPIPGGAKACDNAPTVDSKTIVSRLDAPNFCNDAGETEFSVWLLICNGSDSTGIAGAEFGIEYGPGLLLSTWSRCVDQDFPENNWPDSGTGNTVVWSLVTNCQNTNSEPFVPKTVVAIIGHLRAFVYGPEILQITPKPNSGDAKVADCDGAEESIFGQVPSHLGAAGFCYDGYNPCGLPTPVENKTWGAIKSGFGG